MSQTMVTVDSLIERGNNFLSIEEFAKAEEYYNRALDIDAKAHSAYWGIVLAERACREDDGSELIAAGLCIDTDPNYRFACQCADAQKRTEYEFVAGMCIHTCHSLLMDAIYRGDILVASLRAKQYAASTLADQQLILLHNTLLRKNAMREFSKETPSALISLLSIYKSNEMFTKLDQEQRFSDKVKAIYRSYMNRLLQEIVVFKTPEEIEDAEWEKKLRSRSGTKNLQQPSLPNLAYDGSFYSDPEYYQYCRKRAARAYANYGLLLPTNIPINQNNTCRSLTKQEENAQLWVKPCDSQSEFIGTDGKPSNVGERWRYLAGYLPESEGAKETVDFAEMILRFFDNAIENGADKKGCMYERQLFFDRTVKKMTIENEIIQLSNLSSDKGSAYNRLIELNLEAQNRVVERQRDRANKIIQNARTFISSHKVVRKKDAVSIEYRIEEYIKELEEVVESIEVGLIPKRNKSHEWFSKLVAMNATNSDEYKSNKIEEERIQHMIATEIDRHRGDILSLRKCYDLLKNRKHKVFRRNIQLEFDI